MRKIPKDSRPYNEKTSRIGAETAKYSQTIGSGIMRSPAIKVRILDEKLLDHAMWRIFPRGYDEKDVSWFLQHVVRSFCVAILRDGVPDFNGDKASVKLLILPGSTRNVRVIEQKEVA